MEMKKRYKVLVENLETGEVEFDVETNAALISCSGDRIEDDQETISGIFSAAIYSAEKIVEKEKERLMQELDKFLAEGG